ncbi:unnamed protein product [Dibothriocephalus latus]|uniref:Reverse transcriptase domain-containing protein n=1 Tax=Dibothriocephalus latus TaxID=60516 RepID=A0A3P7MA74_DIBLA|nr:unnamed protein product [Dibothriocephalus latus]
MLTHTRFSHMDQTRTFNTVNRDGIWKIIHVVRRLHNRMTARVTDHETVSEAVAVINRVKQAYVPDLILFNLMASALLMDAYIDEPLESALTNRPSVADRLPKPKELLANLQCRQYTTPRFSPFHVNQSHPPSPLSHPPRWHDYPLPLSQQSPSLTPPPPAAM